MLVTMHPVFAVPSLIPLRKTRLWISLITRRHVQRGRMQEQFPEEPPIRMIQRQLISAPFEEPALKKAKHRQTIERFRPFQIPSLKEPFGECPVIKARLFPAFMSVEPQRPSRQDFPFTRERLGACRLFLLLELGFSLRVNVVLRRLIRISHAQQD